MYRKVFAGVIMMDINREKQIYHEGDHYDIDLTQGYHPLILDNNNTRLVSQYLVDNKNICSLVNRFGLDPNDDFRDNYVEIMDVIDPNQAKEDYPPPFSYYLGCQHFMYDIINELNDSGWIIKEFGCCYQFSEIGAPYGLFGISPLYLAIREIREQYRNIPSLSKQPYKRCVCP